MSISSAIANDRLTSLRMKKKQAIQALDFDAAEELDRQINEQNKDIINTQISKISDDIIKSLIEHYKRTDAVRREIAAFHETQECQININYQGIYTKAQTQNQKEMKSLEKSHATALHREAEREVTEQIDLLEQAKAAAIEGNYAQAKELRARAREVGEAELNQRQTQTDEEFEQSRNTLAQKQQETINQISANYDKEIENLNNEVNIRSSECEERYNSGLDLIRERANIRCNALLADDETKQNAIDEINQRIDETLVQLENQTQQSSPKSHSKEGKASSPKSVVSKTSARYSTSSAATPKKMTSSSSSPRPTSKASSKLSVKSYSKSSAKSSAKTSTTSTPRPSASSSSRKQSSTTKSKDSSSAVETESN